MTSISVTRRCLTEGIPGARPACPVVLAVVDAFPDAQNVTVGNRYVSMYYEERDELMIIPEEIRSLIADIDTGTPVEPFTFELDYPKAAA